MIAEDDADRRDDDDDEDPLIREILDKLARGESVDFDELIRCHPNREATIQDFRRADRFWRHAATTSAIDAAASLAPGTVVGDFVILDVLARGGNSVVYRAKQRGANDRTVALKVVPEVGTDDARRRQFERECEMLAELSHVALVQLYAWGESEHGLYCAMRLVVGMTLRRFIEEHVRVARRAKHGGALVDRALEIGIQVAGALKFLHDEGLIHRDVKPSNIILETDGGETDGLPDGQAVLVDFGLTKRVDAPPETLSREGVATLPFAPPEQLESPGDVDARVDVFAFGITLRDLLTGQTPDDRAASPSRLPSLRQEAPHVPAALAAVIDKATSRDRDERHANAGELLRDLRAVSRHDSMWRLRSVQASRRFARRAMRHAGLLVTMLLLVVIASWFVVEWRATDRIASASTRDDLLEFSRAVESSGFLPDVVLDLEARGEVERLGADPATRAVVEALHRDDVETAMRIEASVLRTHGYRTDLLGRDFLRRGARRWERLPPPDASRPRASGGDFGGPTARGGLRGGGA